MYQRQLIATLSLISFCLVLLGTGFFSLYYQYHLDELRKSVVQDVGHISKYAKSVLQNESDLTGNDFKQYLESVAMISDTTILLTSSEGVIQYAIGNDINLSLDPEKKVPTWIAKATLDKQTFTEFTTFNDLFAQSMYVTGVPIVAHQITFDDNRPIELEVPIGMLYVATDASHIKNFLQDALQLFLMTAFAVLMLSLVICAITAQYMVKPLREISDAVYRFAHGDMDTRLEEYSHRKDEVGDLTKAFNTMAESISVAELRRSEFVANVSHELKTPMTTIAGFADGMLDGTIPQTRQRESLKVISSETRRLSRLIRRMLELSRLQSQERVSAQVQFDISELLLRVLFSLESKVTEKQLEVITDLPPKGLLVWGDPDAITQVCYNLLDNAIKFSKFEGHLDLNITSKAGKAYISIQNEGEEIPKEQLPHVFDRFHKADSSRSEKEGVGLGLYIVKTILNTYKETISVTSEDGKTTFIFTMSEV